MRLILLSSIEPTEVRYSMIDYSQLYHDPPLHSEEEMFLNLRRGHRAKVYMMNQSVPPGGSLFNDQ